MTLALMLPLLLSPQTDGGRVVDRVNEPPIQVWLNQDGSYRHTDRAEAFVRMAEDGYLVVLRNDADGHVRVLFPIDPADNNFLQGGKTLEIRGRGDQEAFSVNEQSGTGLVLAARSVTPFRFDDFVQGDHWDIIALDTLPPRSDKEAALLDVARRMAADSHFDYDDVSYTVETPSTAYQPSAPCYGCSSPYYGYGWSPQFGVALGFGSGFAFRRSACFGPFFDPFFCDPFFFDPFFRPVFFRSLFFDPFFAPVIIENNIVIIFRGGGFTIASPFSHSGRPGFRRPFVFKGTVPPEKGVDARPRFRIPPSAVIDRAMQMTATGGPRLVRVIKLGATPAPPVVRGRDLGSLRALVPVRVRGRIQPTAPVAPGSKRLPARTSGRVPWPVRVPWPIRLDDHGMANASEPVRGRELTPERCVGCAIPNVRVREPSEVERRGFAPNEQWGGRSDAWGAPRTEGAGHGWSAPRSSGSARGVTGRGWGGGRRP